MPDDVTLEAFVAQIADRTPAPGGGGVAATACAMAAALVEMAARFGTDPAAGAEAQEAAQLRGRALELIDADAAAFGPVLAAARAGEDPEPARQAAAEPPLEMARIGARLAELAAGRAADGNPNLRGDAVTGALLAEAGTRSAVELVAINLTDPADPRRVQAAQAASSAARARSRALGAAGEE
ncbi:MAG TPA: cyclodeaminase/cyclohydrolase family protein [Solirubrobacteraceae bacterium]|nr:cyclodeaminase/cyclohydrolase family protein [Solirubrobacteraceae bacterium]